MRAAFAGQNTSPKGMIFSGTELQPECHALQDVLTPYVEAAGKVMFLYFYTSVGDTKGVMKISTVNPRQTQEDQILQQMFPASDCKDQCIVEKPSKDNTVQGEVIRWIHSRFPEKIKNGSVAITAEFASTGGLEFILSIINENQCTNFNNCDGESLEWHRNRLRKVFNPLDDKFQSAVLKNGEQLCRAMNRFIKP